MDNYIAIDAHSKTCTLVTMNRDGGIKDRARVKTSKMNLLAYVKAQEGTKILTFEEGHLSHWLYLLYKDQVDELIVCNPVYVGKKRGAKGDYKDTINLCNKLRSNDLTPVYHEDLPLWNLRKFVSGYLYLNRQIIQTKNRYKALFRSQAILLEGDSVYEKEELIKDLKGDIDQFVARQLAEQLKSLEERKSSYKPYFDEYEKQFPMIRKLCTVPAIGTIRATIIAALVCSPQRFRTKHKFWAYAMLVKYIDESDDVTYGKRLVQGRRELKSLFDSAAICALRGTSSLRKYYDRQRSKGVSHKEAKKDVSRKMAAICLAILKTGKKYDDKYEEKRERLNNKKSV